MTERETDFDFDFFDEPQTRETEAPPRRTTRAAPRRPPRPPSGITPLLRLAGLIAFVILVVVLLVFWVQSCRGERKSEAYRDYMNGVRAVALESAQLGRSFNNVVTTPGIKQTELQSRLAGLEQQQLQGVGRAQELEPPGPLRVAQQQVVEALQLRASGLGGLADTFRRTATSRNLNDAGDLLAAQAQRLVASDVIWDDLFKDPSIEELKRQGIRGVAVPDSNFVQDADLLTARGMVRTLARIRGASTGGTPGGLHGTALISVKALPGGQELSTETQNVVQAGTDLAFEVTVEDSGDSQEVQIPVTLTIQQTPSPIVKRQTIDVIDPGERKTLVFRNIGEVTFAQKTTVRVDVRPVRGETRVTNNTAEYPVIFSVAG